MVHEPLVLGARGSGVDVGIEGTPLRNTLMCIILDDFQQRISAQRSRIALNRTNALQSPKNNFAELSVTFGTKTVKKVPSVL